jgi:hypothetical protein
MLKVDSGCLVWRYNINKMFHVIIDKCITYNKEYHCILFLFHSLFSITLVVPHMLLNSLIYMIHIRGSISMSPKG